MSDSQSNVNRPGTAAWQFIEPHWRAVSIYDGPVVFLEQFGRVCEPVRHVFAVWWCDSEVCNGGFHQFFSNSTGVLAPEASEGFQAIGLPELADLVRTAISNFDEPYPSDCASRRAALKNIQLPGEKREQWDPFYLLDRHYYGAKNRVSFYDVLDDFVRHHIR